MKKTILSILAIIYAIIAIFVTVCLLSFNDYRVSEFGNTSLVIIKNNELAPEFNKGDLVIASNDSKIEIGDSIFFYDRTGTSVRISYAKVEEVETSSYGEKAYKIEGDYKISGDNVIGSSTDLKVIGTVGTILSVLESRWGFLFLIVLPTLIAFLYEIVEVISEIKNSKKKE